MSNYADGRFDTRYGTIHVHNPGSTHEPENLQTLRRVKGGAAVHGCKYSKSAGDVKLQGPALRAFREAEYQATPPRRRRRGLVDPIILTGVGYRSFRTQSDLFYGPDNDYGRGTRFANPNGSLHVEGIAIDIHTWFLGLLAGIRAKKALIAEGWIFGVPGEKWHASFRLPG